VEISVSAWLFPEFMGCIPCIWFD